MKNQNIKWTSIIAAIIWSAIITSCDSKKEQDTTAETEDMEDTKKESTSAVDTEGEPEFLVNYMDMKNAMVNDNYEKAKQAASKMENSLRQSELNEEQHSELMSLIKEFENSENIDNQRLHFTELSHELFRLLQENDVTSKTLYWAYCPMALDNGGGHWLSYTKEIQNPFMGQRMPKCGKVTETLN